MASTAAIQQVAEKYIPEIVAGVSHPIDYRDARVESDRVVVKTTEMDPKLRGWLGYAVPVTTISRGKRKGVGVLGKPEDVVLGEPSVNEFLMWAKQQKIKVLTQYLAEQKIKATGDIVFMLAYRLTYCYEQAWHERRGTWPLEPVKMEVRKRKIETLTKFLNTKGVGNHPDEFAIVQKMFLEEGKPQPNYRTGETRVADEKRSDVLKRLRQQAAETEEKGDEKEEKGKKGGEVDAVKKGKATKDEKVVDDKKGKDKKSKTEPPAAPASEEKEDVSKKSDKKASKKADKKEKVAKAPKAAKPAKEKAEKKGNSNAKAKDFPIGCKVKYIGTRVKHHVGKTGEVVSHKSEKGLAIKWSDGLVATATAGAVEKVGK